MEITTKQLRIQPGKIISQACNGQEIIVTFRGKAVAKIVPVYNKSSADLAEADDELFGMWKNREDMADVDAYVRNLRKGRQF
ncbi:type II toxin-antitoxin system prevent-host-death family antitoxin [Treponema primitia]|uniref:type II toxin-antitoxin system Phd/YefM family antitoxin n=1 Tax=Treponema primitia TaxID=88058 RepID=UPI00397EB312